jgi:hypothetical protein
MLARTVHCADWVAQHMRIGLSEWTITDWPDGMSRLDFDINEQTLARLEADVRAEYLDGASLKAA